MRPLSLISVRTATAPTHHARVCPFANLTATVLLMSCLPNSLWAQPDSVARRHIQPLPAIGSAPETGLQYGATLLGVWQPAAQFHTRPSSVLGYALRTGKSQTRVGLETEHWSRGNNRRLAATTIWQEFPLPFYGFGDRTAKSAEEIYTPKGIEVTMNLQQRITGTWYATGGVRHLNQTITADTIGVLRANTFTGSSGGRITEWSAGALADTRDNLFAPRTGQLLQVNYALSQTGMLSDFHYGRLRVDARDYRSSANHHVLATQFVVVGVNGDAPFDQTALIGGSDIMRGYARGRFRDRWMAATQAEYRSPVRYRVGAVLFAGAGVAAPTISDMRNSVLLPTYGAGARVQIDERQRTSIRADYGRGRTGASGVYIGFNQAF